MPAGHRQFYVEKCGEMIYRPVCGHDGATWNRFGKTLAG